MKNPFTSIVLLCFLIVGCQQKQVEVLDVDSQLDYCVEQASKTLSLIPKDSLIPRNISPKDSQWNFVNYKDWTSGFWPGTLWYLYEYTNDDLWKINADKFSEYLKPLSVEPALDHDLGFQVFNSYGHGYRLTNNEDYKEIILKTADTLATLFNPNVGTILSWPRSVPNMEWPQHNTIIDNLINLELLFWASKNGGSSGLYDIAVRHAETTMKNHFRPDNTSYHVVIYDKDNGKKIKAVTHQGLDDETMWARGQAWAIYGYTMIYRETKDPRFLEFAHAVTRPFLDGLPTDLIPYWDFDAAREDSTPKDASAAAVVASALLELASYTEDAKLKEEYLNKAEQMLFNLSSKTYQSRNQNSAFLLHSTGHFPNGSEIDYSIIYADYYYIEGLIRLRRIRNGEDVI